MVQLPQIAKLCAGLHARAALFQPQYLLLALFCSSVLPLSNAHGAPADYASKLKAANLAINSGKLATASALLNELIALAPTQPAAYNNLAVIAARQGDDVKAQQLLQKALNSQHNYAQSYANISKLNQAMALASYKQSLQLGPETKRIELKLIEQVDLPSTGQSVEKIVYRDKIIEKPVEKIVYRDNAASSKQCPPQAARVVIDNCKTKPAASADINAARQVIQNWALAWQERDVDSYIDSYTADFANVQSGKHRDWVQYRRERLLAPKFINLEIANLQIKALSHNVISASFLQKYQSDSMTDTISKQLILVLEKQLWKIAEENVLR